MSLVTLLLSLQLGAAQTSQHRRTQSTSASCKAEPTPLLPSLALGNRSLCQSSQASLPKHLYQQRAQMQPLAPQHTMSQSPRHKRRHQQKARAKKAASQPSAQHQQQLQSLQTTFCRAVSADGHLGSQGRVALTRPLDLVSDLGGQQGTAGLGHSVPEPMQLEPSSPTTNQVSSPVSATPMEVSATVIDPLVPPYLHLFQQQHQHQHQHQCQQQSRRMPACLKPRLHLCNILDTLQ